MPLSEISNFLKSIGFEGSKKNCIEAGTAERQLIDLENDEVDSDNEYNPSFVCDKDMATNLELYETPCLKDVKWIDKQVHGIHSTLTHIVLAFFIPQCPLIRIIILVGGR